MSFLIPDINTFFLLHTHFFSLLVYHVPILSCNPTVYTLCTVSTWGSVYVGKNNRRFSRKGSCNRNSLLLSTRQIIRHAGQLFLQPQQCNNVVNISFIRSVPVKFNWQNDIFIHIQDRHQIIILKYKSNPSSSENRKLIRFHLRNILSAHNHSSVCWCMQSSEHM